MRYLPMMGVMGLLVLLAFMLVGRDGTHTGTEQKPMPLLALPSMDGKTQWKQEALKGHVTVLNFFASWCTPCAAEMPELGAFKKQFPQVKFEGIAWNDDPQTIAYWLKKNGNPFDALWMDSKGDATMALGIKGIPETIIVDGNGIIRYRLSGPLTKAVRTETIDPLVTQLIGEQHAR